jgi:hypothetical protein
MINLRRAVLANLDARSRSRSATSQQQRNVCDVQRALSVLPVKVTYAALVASGQKTTGDLCRQARRIIGLPTKKKTKTTLLMPVADQTLERASQAAGLGAAKFLLPDEVRALHVYDYVTRSGATEDDIREILATLSPAQTEALTRITAGARQ